eukprot:4875277-Pleurochrysis_carterae.AAC.1
MYGWSHAMRHSSSRDACSCHRREREASTALSSTLSAYITPQSFLRTCSDTGGEESVGFWRKRGRERPKWLRPVGEGGGKARQAAR